MKESNNRNATFCWPHKQWACLFHTFVRKECSKLKTANALKTAFVVWCYHRKHFWLNRASVPGSLKAEM